MGALSSVIQSGIHVLLWAGDADWICNWAGVEQVADGLTVPGQDVFRQSPLVPFTVHGVQKGSFKTAGNLSLLRVFEAGHEVPYYRMCSSSSSFCLLLLRCFNREFGCADVVYRLIRSAEPETSLQVFIQTLSQQLIWST